MIKKTFTIVTDVWDDMDILDENDNVTGTEQVLIKKNVKLRTSIFLEHIKRYDETVNDKGNVRKGYTKLFLDSGDQVIVKESYNNIDKMMEVNKIGFEYGR